ncbi:hypothetical protein ACX0HA_13885 [Flavobacterium hauense]
MKRVLFLLFFSILLGGCQRSNNALKISFSRACGDNTSSVQVYGLQVIHRDSIFFSRNIPMRFSVKDTLKLDSLPDGLYEISYYDIRGEQKSRKINLKENKSGFLNIILDSIDSNKFLNKTPIKNLKEGESYTLDWKGGDIASMYGYYKIGKKKGDVYFETPNYNIEKLTQDEINLVMQYEAELLAIQSMNAKGSLNSFAYKINKNGKITEIIDDTRNWAGYRCTIGKIYSNRFKGQ